jgi:hypothetical protein
MTIKLGFFLSMVNSSTLEERDVRCAVSEMPRVEFRDTERGRVQGTDAASSNQIMNFSSTWSSKFRRLSSM